MRRLSPLQALRGMQALHDTFTAWTIAGANPKNVPPHGAALLATLDPAMALFGQEVAGLAKPEDYAHQIHAMAKARRIHLYWGPGILAYLL